MVTGSCLCGAVWLRYDGAVGPITMCHCTQCRKTSGHVAASFDVDSAKVAWTGDETVRTHATPGGATRGFCGTCGSRLWFRAADGALSIEAGLIDGPTGGFLAGHIFTAVAGDYYDIDDDLPKKAGP